MRAQSAVEYAMIVGIAIIILIPLWININNTLGVTKIGLQSSYSKHAVSKLVSAADAVYVQGKPAKFTLLIHFPDGVENVTIGSHEISLRTSSSAGLADTVGTTLGTVQGSLSTSPGAHRVTVEALDSSINITEG